MGATSCPCDCSPCAGIEEAAWATDFAEVLGEILFLNEKILNLNSWGIDDFPFI